MGTRLYVAASQRLEQYGRPREGYRYSARGFGSRTRIPQSSCQQRARTVRRDTSPLLPEGMEATGPQPRVSLLHCIWKSARPYEFEGSA